MSTLRVLNSKGDRAITWVVDKVKTGDPEAVAAVQEAERIFRSERARGATAFSVRLDGTAERMEAFDRTAEQIVIVPRIAGGAA